MGKMSVNTCGEKREDGDQKFHSLQRQTDVRGHVNNM